jgi:N-acetyl sugar amidotransferase
MEEKDYQICTRCVMDTTDPNIVFNKKGECNHCVDWFKKIKTQSNSIKVDSIIKEIKDANNNSEYDCLVGISGGVDSTYLVYILVKEYNLNPLVVHLDNGWNSKLAVKNIKNIIKKLDVDLHTHVIDWEEFKKLQKSYFKASVMDIEVLTDHAIGALLYESANKYNIKHILGGFNAKTEMIIPKDWTFNKNDLQNILDIVSKNSDVEIKSFPTLGEKKLNQYKKKIKSVNFFDYIDYDDKIAKQTIIDELKWVDYGGKHFESTFTRFYQGYILPEKFNIDKRKAHLSSLICLNNITRKEALEKLKAETYDLAKQEEDYSYVIKKLDFTKEEFENYMNSKRVSHFAYKTNFSSVLRKKLNLPDKFYNKYKYK